MPIDLDSIPEHLIEAVSSGNVVPFIGAGVSRLATGAKKPLPTWDEFMEDLLEVARFKGLQDHDEEQIRDLIKNGKFLMAAQALKEAIGDGQELSHYIRKRFLSSGAQPGKIHDALFRLQPQIIMTTNYDTLLETACARNFGRDVEPVTPDKAHLIQQVLKGYEAWETPLIFKIHGTARDPDNIIFAERDYRELLYGLRGYRAVLSALFVTKVVLMLGFSNSDPEITMVLQTLREGFRQRSSPDYIVLKRGVKRSVEKRRLSHDFGLEVIEYDDSDDHNELVQLVEHLATFIPERPKARASGQVLPRHVNATPYNDL